MKLGFNRKFLGASSWSFRTNRFLKFPQMSFNWKEIKNLQTSELTKSKLRINVTGNSKTLIQFKLIQKYDLRPMMIESNILEFAFYFDIKHSIVGIHLSKLDDEIWLTLSYDGQLIEIYEHLKKDETIKDTIKLEKFESEEKRKIVIDEKIKNLISEAIEFMKHNLSLQERIETVKELKEIYEVKISAYNCLEKLRKNGKLPKSNTYKFETYFLNIGILLNFPKRTRSTVLLKQTYQSYVKEHGDYPFIKYKIDVMEYVHNELNKILE